MAQHDDDRPTAGAPANAAAGGHRAYVERVREDTRRYVESLLGENDQLRRQVVALESEKGRLMVDKMSLQEKVLALRDEIDRLKGEREAVERRLGDVERDHARATEQFLAVEAQNNNLANLYVASYQLHSTSDRDEVLAAIQEIIINLIGSEELVIYERGGDDLLVPVASFGMAQDRLAPVALGRGLVGRAAERGEALFPTAQERAQATREEQGLTACVPLKLGETVLGAIAVFGLLSHKNGLEELDYELFDLLATHAATSLYVTRLERQEVGQGGAAAETSP